MLRLQLALLSLAPVMVLAGCPAADDDPDASDDTGDATNTPADDGGSGNTPGTDTGADTGADSGVDPSADSSTGSGVDADTGSESGSGGPDLAELYDCEEPDLIVAQAFGGPGFDPETGQLLEPIADEYVVSTTQLLPKPDEAAQAAFLELTNGVVAQLMETPGFLGLSLAFEPSCGFARTLTVWESEEAMFAFVNSGAHVEAMGQTFAVGVTGRVTSWTAPAEEMPPSWEDAIAKIAEVDPIGGY